MQNPFIRWCNEIALANCYRNSTGLSRTSQPNTGPLGAVNHWAKLLKVELKILHAGRCAQLSLLRSPQQLDHRLSRSWKRLTTGQGTASLIHTAAWCIGSIITSSQSYSPQEYTMTQASVIARGGRGL